MIVKNIVKTVRASAWFVLVSGCMGAQPIMTQSFITRDGHRLMDGDQEFRFAGIHAPELHRIEDDSKGACPNDPRGWGQYFKWPSALEQESWIQSLADSGHKAMRVYVLSVASPFDAACGRETHILPPTSPDGMPVLNKQAFIIYDRMISLAGDYNLRLILPFIDHWHWWGGREQLAAFYGESADDFYRTGSKTYAAYLNIIEQVVTRKNTITGSYYYDDPAIMAWETGNELKGSTAEFVRKTAAHIKSLAPSQLVVDGTYLKIIPESLEDPNIDIISNHFYTVNNNNNPEQIKSNLASIAEKKAYLVGEYGLLPSEGMRDIMQTAVHYEHNGAKTSGIFVWGFRGHREEGGFYWHKEYTGHYSYHLPGFADNDNNEERAVVALVREAQAQMAGLSEIPPLPKPKAPLLHAIANPKQDIRWMGAALASHYRVERAPSEVGPWLAIADSVSDGRNEFNPDTDSLFSDAQLSESGTWYYRVIAMNESGESPPSNVVSVEYVHP